MNIIKKIAISAAFALCTQQTYAVTTKTAEEVFKKWFEWQQIVADGPLSSNEFDIESFRTSYEKQITTLRSLNPILSLIVNQNIDEHGYSLRSPMDTALQANITALYHALDTDMRGFINFMHGTNLTDPKYVKDEESGPNATGTTEKYNALFQILFANTDQIKTGKHLFNLGNRFFEHCFGETTFPEFQNMLLNKSSYPISRMLYATTWYNLAGNGWKNWSENSLKTLKEKADMGHQIVYIAGGSDIYQMIKEGVYNIKNIDPQLPSQPKYYADGWTFILRGEGPDNGMGDKIVFNFPDDRVITMERTSYKQFASTFKARIATGEVIELPHSITTWTLTDKTGQKVGEYVLERRFCQQSDFTTEPNKTMLVSFNELYFLSLPDFLSGWGITPTKFPHDFSIIVKQLHKPVTRQMAVNMRIASLLNSSDFRYIALGTCIN